MKSCFGQEDNIATGLTPLMYAVKGGFPECVQVLLNAKADVNAVDESLVRPLHFAAACAELDIARRLLKAGADANAHDWDLRNALSYLPQDVVNSPRALGTWQCMLAKSG